MCECFFYTLVLRRDLLQRNAICVFVVSISRNRLSVHLLSRNRSCANYSFHFFNCHEAKPIATTKEQRKQQQQEQQMRYKSVHEHATFVVVDVFVFFKTSRAKKRNEEIKHDVNSPWKMPMQINLSQARPLGIRAWASVTMGKNGKSKRNWNQWIGFFRYNLHNAQMHWLELESKRHNNRKEKEGRKRFLSVHTAHWIERGALVANDVKKTTATST